MSDKNEKYREIISLSRPRALKHPPMPREDRAAQFAPFSALDGHSDKIEEAAKSNSFNKNRSS